MQMQMHIPKKVTQKVLSILFMFTGAILLVLGLVFAQSPQPVQAVSSDLANVRAAFPSITGTDLDSCTLCHTSGSTLNSFGRAYLNNGRSRAAAVAIQNQDSDGDGFTNLAEINALTFPGDSSSVPIQQATPTRTVTRTAAPTRTQTATPIPTNTRTATNTAVPANTATHTATQTPTVLVVPSGTATGIATSNATSVATATQSTTGTPGVTPTVSTLVLTPEADTFTSQANRSKNYGTRDFLRIDKDPLYRAYIRFDLRGVNVRAIRKAELRVYVVEESDTGFSVREYKRNNWDERRLTFSNASGAGDFVARSPIPAAGKWITVDVTSFVKSANAGEEKDGDDDDREGDDDDDKDNDGSRGRISIALYGGSNNGVSIASKESGANAPQLIITR